MTPTHPYLRPNHPLHTLDSIPHTLDSAPPPTSALIPSITTYRETVVGESDSDQSQVLARLDHLLEHPPAPHLSESPELLVAEDIPDILHQRMSSPAAIDVIQEGSSFQLKPEPFDGDKTKFKSFMRQVMLAFRAAPTKFASDE